ncbi:sulfite exporter TauE/SafE family protein [Cupriavidus basilensis]|uniref:Probable membrane transporter protein n=1 Tax=Cupriavidus basilensis TaxID=68895 RepID=A0ABT6AMU5_9BURK|nr:sulfite exporter TauE/SafE family protein [Cupriavidus basilensis]MDF3833946.1 sulfite exporter TauE/SafE family protein [Cupriavidus basilensis]
MESVVATSAVLGGVVGLILALTGAGGAILAVPLLLFVLHLGMAEAGPIALLAVGVSAALGAVIGLRAGIVRYRAAALMAVAGTICSPLGLWLAHRLPNRPLTLLFAGVLAFVSLRMLRQASAPALQAAAPSGPPQPCQLDSGSGRFIWTAACTRALAASGIGAGFLSGLLGVGGGFVIVPALKRATNAPMHAIVATSLAVITLVSASGVISTALAGRMNWHVGLPFAFGALGGMLLGRVFSSRVSGPRLQQGFAVVAGLVSFGMVAKALFGGA